MVVYFIITLKRNIKSLNTNLKRVITINLTKDFVNILLSIKVILKI
jgi:hypothetical protein